MHVTLRLLGALDDFMPPGKRAAQDTPIELPDGAVLAKLVEYLELSADAQYFAMVNNDKIDTAAVATAVLKDGDTVVLCAAIKGG